MTIARTYLCLIALLASATSIAADVQPGAPAPVNAELARMFAEDQSDREPADGKEINWSVVSTRDQARRKRVLEMYRADELRTGEDLYHAAMILQHGYSPEDYLLAHELCVTAVFAYADGSAAWVDRAKWLAAASEDRFLNSIGRQQRFATQYRSTDTSVTLEPVEHGVTDALRANWRVPPLAAAKAREAELRKDLQPIKEPELLGRLKSLTAGNPARFSAFQQIVDKHGWPGTDLVGLEGNNIAFDIALNAPAEQQKTLLPLLTRAAEEGRAPAVYAAVLEDRIRVADGRNQLYGTMTILEADGTPQAPVVDDPEHLDERRKAVGLPPLAEQMAQFKAKQNK